MPNNLLVHARQFATKIVSNGGFSEDITLTSEQTIVTADNEVITADNNQIGSDGLMRITTKSLTSKHWINFDENGIPSDSKKPHVCVSESDLISKGFRVRNNNKEVYLIGVNVEIADSSGVVKTYTVARQFPDEALGLIICILTDLED